MTDRVEYWAGYAKRFGTEMVFESASPDLRSEGSRAVGWMSTGAGFEMATALELASQRAGRGSVVRVVRSCAGWPF